MRPSRRAALGGGLAAALWSSARGADAQKALVSDDGFRLLAAAPSRLPLAPPPAEPLAALSYAGQTPGPLLRLRKGEELRLRLMNALAEPTTLAFPGCLLYTSDAADE